MKLLAFDTETGGLDPKETSLLTAYFQVFDENFNTIDSLYLKVIPNDGLIKANEGALKVNKINLEAHKEEAIPYNEAKVKLTQFLAKYSTKYDKLTPVAHNIDFDLGYLFEHLVTKKEWENYVSYRKLDTAQIANFLKLAGRLPAKQGGSLGDLAKCMNIQFDGAAHSADADTKVLVELLRSFVEAVQ